MLRNKAIHAHDTLLLSMFSSSWYICTYDMYLTLHRTPPIGLVIIYANPNIIQPYAVGGTVMWVSHHQ